MFFLSFLPKNRQASMLAPEQQVTICCPQGGQCHGYPGSDTMLVA